MGGDEGSLQHGKAYSGDRDVLEDAKMAGLGEGENDTTGMNVTVFSRVASRDAPNLLWGASSGTGYRGRRR